MYSLVKLALLSLLTIATSVQAEDVQSRFAARKAAIAEEEAKKEFKKLLWAQNDAARELAALVREEELERQFPEARTFNPEERRRERFRKETELAILFQSSRIYDLGARNTLLNLMQNKREEITLMATGLIFKVDHTLVTDDFRAKVFARFAEIISQETYQFSHRWRWTDDFEVFNAKDILPRIKSELKRQQITEIAKRSDNELISFTDKNLWNFIAKAYRTQPDEATEVLETLTQGMPAPQKESFEDFLKKHEENEHKFVSELEHDLTERLKAARSNLEDKYIISSDVKSAMYDIERTASLRGIRTEELRDLLLESVKSEAFGFRKYALLNLVYTHESIVTDEFRSEYFAALRKAAEGLAYEEDNKILKHIKTQLDLQLKNDINPKLLVTYDNEDLWEVLITYKQKKLSNSSEAFESLESLVNSAK